MSEQLPQYQCHKVVRAAKVTKFPVATRVHCDVDGEEVHVTIPVALGHGKELVGGYIVVYEDGYISWSPASAFETGYTLIEERDGEPAAASSPSQPPPAPKGKRGKKADQ